MGKYKLSDESEIDISGWGSLEQTMWKIENPEATLIEPVDENFLTGDAEVDALATQLRRQASNGELTSANGLSAALKIEDFANLTFEDLKGNEEKVDKKLREKLAVVGLQTRQADSFEDLDAINITKGSMESKLPWWNLSGLVADKIGDFLFTPFSSSTFAVGDDVSDERLQENADAINKYIIENADLKFAQKAQERSGKLYNEEYIPFVTPKTLDKKQIETKYIEDTIEKFKDIKSREQSIEMVGEYDSTTVYTPASIDSFKDKTEFKNYKLWEQGKPMTPPSEDEATEWDNARKSESVVAKSSEFANDINIDQRLDILALAKLDQIEINNFGEAAKKFDTEVQEFEYAIDEYKTAPSQDKYIALQSLNISIIEEQTRLQAVQARAQQSGLLTRASVIPLAIKDFNKSYSRLNQLGTGFKDLGGKLAYGVVVLAQMSQDKAYWARSNAYNNMLIEKDTGLVSFAESMQDEAANYQTDPTVDEIRSLSDATRWVAGASMNLAPSLAMAATGPAALPMFFMSGFGGATQSVAVEQKGAVDRMLNNRKWLTDNPDAAIEERLEVEGQMDEDTKVLNIENWRVLSNAALHGVAEVVLEKIGTMAIIKSVKEGVKGIPITNIKEGFKFFGKEVGSGIVREGSSEYVTTLIQNFGDIFILDEDKSIFNAVDWDGVTEGGLESFAQGALMGGGMQAITGVKGLKVGLSSTLATRQQKEDMKSLVDRLINLTGIEGLQSIDDIAALQEAGLELPEGVQKMVDEAVVEGTDLYAVILEGLQGKLSREQLIELGEIDRKQRALSKQLRGASVQGLPAAQLKAYQKELKREFDELDDQRELIFGNEVVARNNQENKATANVKWEVLQGYKLYSAVMLNESKIAIIQNYNQQDSVTKQKGFVIEREKLEKIGKPFTEKDVEKAARNSYVSKAYRKMIETSEKSVKAFVEAQGLDINIISTESIEETIKAFEDNAPAGTLDEKAASGKTNRQTILDGEFEGGEVRGGNGLIIIDKSVSSKNGRVGIVAHEVLHFYARQKYGENKEAIDLAGKDLLDFLEKNEPDIFAKVKHRIDASYAEKDENNEVTELHPDYYEEAMNAMSDVLADGQKISVSTLDRIRMFANAFLSKLDKNGRFFTKEQGYESYIFVRDYNQSAHSGKKYKGTSFMKAEPEEVEETVDKSSTTLSITPAEQARKALDAISFENLKRQRAQNIIGTELPGMVGASIYKRFGVKGLSVAKQKAMADEVIERIYRAGETLKWGTDKDGNEMKSKGSLYGFLNGRIGFRIDDTVKKEYSRDPLERLYFSEADGNQFDTLENAGDIANEEDTATTETPSFKKITDSNVISNGTIDDIKAKVLSTVRTLKSKMDAKISLNRTVTPLIAEIKKKMGIQADIDFKEAMGGKADGKLKKWLLKNKKVILENMTTTWLMGAIPLAVEKQVDGKWLKFPAWEGKKVDRASVTTDKAGRTDGKDLVKRVKNVSDFVEDDDFVAYILNKTGTPIRGKKESLAKAMAEEVSFEIFSKELHNEDGIIRQAFERNQKALGVVIADNIIEEINKQIDRGGVKLSTTAIGLKINHEIAEAIGTEIFRNKLTTNILDPKNDRPLYTAIVDYFTDFPVDKIKTVTQLKNIAKELSSDYTLLKTSREIGIQRVVELEGVVKTIDYLLEASKDALTQGNSYATIQLILKGENTKLDDKTLEGLNLGRQAALRIVKRLAKKGFTGNEIKNIFTAIYSPSGLGGFKGKLAPKKEQNKKGDKRATPKSVTLTKSDLGIEYQKENKKTGKLERQSYGSFMISTADFEQNFLKGIEMGPTNSTRTDAFTKNFWKDPKSTYNNLDNEGKKKYLQELQKGKEKYKASLLVFIEAVISADLSIDAIRTFIRAPFAAMDGIGKITSAPRWMPALMDGTLLSLDDLVKLGFGRTDGLVDQGVFEHTKPANRVALAAFRYALTGKKSDLDALELELTDFDTAFITEGMDKELVRNKLQSLMGLNYVRGAGVMNTRYVEMVAKMADAGITFYDAKTDTLLSAATVFSKEILQEMETNFAPVATAQNAIQQGTKLSVTPKKIRVFDFDDTLARTKSNVLYVMPDGTKGKINPATFARDAAKMEAEGAVWDFSEFSKIMEGKKGPLLEVAKIIADKRGAKDVFVLTARPQDAAGPIKEFLASMGLNIPLKNITGLGNGSPQAKADWMIPKIAEGYNDFYFADDHVGNVKAVKETLKESGVKTKVQLAKVKFSLSTKVDVEWEMHLGDVIAYGQMDLDGVKVDINVREPMFETYEDNHIPGLDFEKVFEVEFDIDKIPEGRKAFKLFGGVINAVKDLVVNGELAGQVDGVLFTGKGKSRARLYKTMTMLLADELGWSYKYHVDNNPGVSPAQADAWSKEFSLPVKPRKGQVKGYGIIYKTPVTNTFTNQPKEVKALLNTFDVKGKVQLAKVKFSLSMDKDFNDMMERNTGTAAAAEFSKIVARRRGAGIGKYKVWMPSSLDDFKGLTSYVFAGKGRQGDADQKFFKDALLTPYFRGVAAIELARQTMKDDFKALNKLFKPVVKKLGKLIPGLEYTNDQAIRVYLWAKAGYDIPGLSKRDMKKLLDHVENNPDLKAYAEGALLISKQPKWVKPTAHWDVQTILSDLGNMTDKSGRKKYIAEFIENVDVIFSEKNLNKVEALYGTRQRDALEDIIYRMKNGTNRPSGMNKNANIFNNWVNNSIGSIMFFNRRSALLQTLSTVNFINWSDNNPAKAALAFANQPQFWKDFATLFNSAKLKQRRSGLKSDINEAEIASAVKGSKNKAVAALSWLLKIGFTPTQIADSFAIAAGGATFYRNRINTLMKKGLSRAEAEAKAFEDFSAISEETQQSGDPALISSDQASTVGRMLLAFQNTPIQLNRSIKKSSLDLYHRRRVPGQTQLQSDLTNTSKIIYYGAIQTILFTALSGALFALLPGFDDDELTDAQRLKLEESKITRMGSSIIDTTLKGGFGLPGAAIAAIKNVIMEYQKQSKKGYNADHTYTILQAANLAPPIGSKLGKLYKGIQAQRFDKEVIQGRAWDVTIGGKFNLSPQYSVLSNWVEGTTNIPLARVVDEVNAITEAFDTRNTVMQRIALSLGWRTWDVSAENEENDLVEIIIKAKNKEDKKKEKDLAKMLKIIRDSK